MPHKVWGSKSKPTMHTSSKHMRPKPQGRGRFTQRFTAADRQLLAILSKPGRYLSIEQEHKLEHLKRKEANHVENRMGK